ncbi:MAG: hypothetical protein LV481_14900 [Methylacidiphilales bacterium]|nr:hypothetical protein [Candidatus Methylacidiphilales bacterium]
MRITALLLVVLSGMFNLRAQTTNTTPNPAPPPWPSNLDEFTVKTNSPENQLVPFYVRIPKGFDPQQAGPYRVLFICPPHNYDGLKTFRNKSDYQELLAVADQRKWFVVSPTFIQKGNVQDRTLCYYYPETFSGKAVTDALDLIAQKYPVDINHIFVHGFSGGAQFAHRFALWAPGRVVAAAINSSSWFDDPTPACNQVAWLVTIGESDPSFENTLGFIGKLQDAGVAPLFRSYIGLLHADAGDSQVVHLDAEFLKFYDDQTRSQLGKTNDGFQTAPTVAMQAKDMPFVGDNQMWEYVPNTDANVSLIAEDSRVYLPSKEIADVWGTPKK